MRLRAVFVLVLFFSGFTGFSQKLFEDKINVRSGSGEEYQRAIIYLPANYNKDNAYPLVLFAHGMGQAGTDINKLYEQGLPKVLKAGYRPPFDFIMVAVQRNSFSIMPEWLAGILNDCEKRWKIDASRIYLTGLSAGGWPVYGSQLNFNPAFAKKFAAIVINSGATQNTNKKNLDWWKESKTPLWAIVGAADKSFLVHNAKMVKEINKRVPGLATLTARPGIGHGGWSDVYSGKVKLDGKDMWAWLYQFKRSESGTKTPPKEQTPPPDTDSTVTSGAGTNYLKVNLFEGANAGTNSSWNNWNLGSGKNLQLKLKYDDGAASTITATLSNSTDVIDNGGDYGGGMAPAAVLRYASSAPAKRILTISGLSSAKTYKLYLYASRRDHSGYITTYQINQDSRTIAVSNNHAAKAYFGNLKPDTNGQVQVIIESKNPFNYLNGFMIVESSK